jgi:MerR family transcriptional regulator, heat shock protein HspR
MDKNVLNTKPVYTISTAAELLEVSIPTLRLYEKEKLIVPYKKESNQRLYSESDLEKIRCIRKAINEDKISIEGIKRIFALIPCWDIIKCSAKERKNCEAYKGHLLPCWSYKHKSNACSGRECRDCVVYNEYADCNSIKERIRKITEEQN